MFLGYQIHNKTKKEFIAHIANTEEELLSICTEYSKIEQTSDAVELVDDTFYVGNELATKKNEIISEQIRRERDQKLEDVAWIAERHRNQRDLGIATTLTDAQYKELLKYMQELRDVPQQRGFPSDVVWPTAPVLADKDDGLKPVGI